VRARIAQERDPTECNVGSCGSALRHTRAPAHFSLDFLDGGDTLNTVAQVLEFRPILPHVMKTQDSAVPLSFQQDSGMAKRRRKARSEPAADTTNGSWSEHPNTRALLNALAALKSGDFSVRLPLDWVGIAGKTADIFNEVVALNQRMARELVRLHKSVGREGRINQRASLGEVEGTWAESVESVNDLIAELAQPTSEMARVIGAVAQGDLSRRQAGRSGKRAGSRRDVERPHR